MHSTVIATLLLLLPFYQVLATHGMNFKYLSTLALTKSFDTVAYFQTDIGFSNEAVERPWYYGEGLRRRCPHCDSSVYSYCSEKLFHDSCCCHNPNNPYGKYPFLYFSCQFSKFSFCYHTTQQQQITKYSIMKSNWKTGLRAQTNFAMVRELFQRAEPAFISGSCY